MNTLDCRFCQGVREHNGKFCMGCGSPIQNASNKKKPPQKRPLKCPRCHSRKYKVHDGNAMVCEKCDAWFDPVQEVFAVDTRPEQNAIKNENRPRQRYGRF